MSIAFDTVERGQRETMGILSLFSNARTFAPMEQWTVRLQNQFIIIY